jgi:uncharacterized protein YprB with RNaseH-like and TPR domain
LNSHAKKFRDLGPGDLLFFDLETTGLSSGAGTVAFLAALGVFEKGGPPRSGSSWSLRITQYLLLDYPGESAFLQVLLDALGERADGPPLLASYNGKSFDAQVLKIRCLMNGFTPPRFFHADLLHPARRLWKTALEDCSQGTIEREILGLSREGDVSGALAPEIWFDFLKTGKVQALKDMAEHNIRDIQGLAAIFAAMTRIAGDPVKSLAVYNYDSEPLALTLRRFLYRQGLRGGEGLFSARDGGKLEGLAGELLENAARRGRGRALYYRGRDLLREGQTEKGLEYIKTLAESPASPALRALALRTLAADARRRLGEPQRALAYINRALALDGLSRSSMEDLLRRRERLEGDRR